MPFSLFKNELSREHRGNLELDAQGDKNVPIQAYSQLGYTTLEMESLYLTFRCKYWWNDEDYSMPFSLQTPQQMAFEHHGNIELDDQRDDNVQAWANSQLD